MLLRDKNIVGINLPFIKIAKNEVLFEIIEWLLSGTKMPLKFKGMMQSSVTDLFLLHAKNFQSSKSII